MNDGRDWFEPKRYGYGSVPVTWQGWALTLAFVALTFALALTLKRNPIQLIAALVLPVIVFTVTVCRKTRGGCRWRWGVDD